MTIFNLEQEWKKVVKETHNKLKCKIPYPPRVALMRELILYAQIFLEKVNRGENVSFNIFIYQKLMAECFRQRLKLKI